MALQEGRRRYDDHRIDLPVAAGFEQQRNIEHDQRRTRTRMARQKPPGRGTYTRVQDGFESAPRRPAKLDGVHVVLAVRRSDLRLALSVMLKTAGARLTLADDDVSPASLLAARFAPEDGAQVVVIELDRPRALRPDTFPALRGATRGVVAIQPSGLPPAVAEQIRLAGVECLTEPLDALRIVNTVARAADAQANRSAG